MSLRGVAVTSWIAFCLGSTDMAKGLTSCIDSDHEQESDPQIGPSAAPLEHDTC